MKYLALNLVLLSSFVFAENENMRECLLLPIVETQSNSLNYEVYEKLETYLQNAKWCRYKSNSEILSILGNYRKNLPRYLQEKALLKTIADKTGTGSIIRVTIKEESESEVFLSLSIIAADGNSIYLDESQRIDNSVDDIRQRVVSWLETYRDTLPYHSQVLNVVGDQISFKYLPLMDIGQEFEVRRFVTRKKHKLLKKVVQWDSDPIAKGRIAATEKGEALGVINFRFAKKKILPGDWIRITKFKVPGISDKEFFAKFPKGDFGRLGKINLSFLMNHFSATTDSAANNIRYANFIYGFSLDAEIWITRHYFLRGEFAKQVGSLDKEGGVAVESSPTTINGVWKLAGGYKFLPLGYFFGPNFDLYGGYSRYNYNLDQSEADGIGEVTLSNLFVGLGGETPIKGGWRGFARLELVPFAWFTDEDDVYGNVDDASQVLFELGGKLQYNQRINLSSSLEFNNASIDLKGDVTSVELDSTVVKIGAEYLF